MKSPTVGWGFRAYLIQLLTSFATNLHTALRKGAFIASRSRIDLPNHLADAKSAAVGSGLISMLVAVAAFREAIRHCQEFSDASSGGVSWIRNGTETGRFTGHLVSLEIRGFT